MKIFIRISAIVCFMTCAKLMNHTQAQTLLPNNNSDSLLFGFDEQKELKALIEKGIPQEDLAGNIKYKKMKFIEARQGVQAQLTTPPIFTTSTDPCENMGFEDGNFNGWQGFTGSCCAVSTPTPGIVTGRHTIMSGPGIDPNVPITVVAPGGGTYSVRLGNDNTGSEAERLKRTFAVTPSNTNFIYQYAVVLEDPNHDLANQPRFEVRVFDSLNNIIPCGYYQVTAQAGIPGFKSVGNVRYKDWTTVGVDLSPYVGQNVSIEFTTADCGYGGHFGYAYIDASCGTLNITSTFCPGDTIVTLTAPSGFTQYTWNTGATTQSIKVVHPVPGTVYTVNMQAVTGCPTNLSITLTQQQIPSITASNDTTVCAGSTVNLSASGGGTYSWSSIPAGFSSTSQYPTATPLVNTKYIVTVTNVCGTAVDTVKVTVIQKPIVNAGPDQILCPGDTAQLTGTSSTPKFFWTTSPTLSCTNCLNPKAFPTVSGPTKYYLNTIDTVTGCSSKDTVIVTINIPTADAGPDKPICAGQSTQLNGTGGATYSWSPATGLSCTTCQNPIANPAVTTKYFVTVSNVGGCSAKDSVTVIVNPYPVPKVTDDTTICSGLTLPLSASGGASYVWSPSSGLTCTICSNPKATVTSTKTYYVTVTQNGCSSVDSVKITIRPAPAADAGPDQFVCPGVPAQLTATTSATVYSWKTSPDLSCTNCLNPTVTTNVTKKYYFTTTDAVTGCSTTDSVKVTVSTPVANAGPDKTICIGTSVQLNGSGGATYSWSPAGTLSCTTCQNPTANPVVTTTYYLTVSNLGGCSNKDSVVVTIAPYPTPDAGADKTICAGQGLQLNATGGITYSWTPSANLSCTSCPNPVATPLVTRKYFVTVGNAGGCTAVDSILITVKPSPLADAGYDQQICPGQTAYLFATSGTNVFSWTPSPDLSCTNCLNPGATPGGTSGSIKYYFNVTDTTANGCNARDSVTVTINPLPIADAGPDTAVCIGSGVQLNGSGGIAYLWTPATGLSCTTCQNPIASPTVKTKYYLKVSNAKDCSSMDSVVVNVNPLPTPNAGADQTICKGNTAQLNASGGTSYLWSPASNLTCTGCVNPVSGTLTTQNYTVTVTDNHGCSASDYMVLTVRPLPTVDAGPNQAICFGKTAQLNATVGGTSFSWTSNPTLSCTNCLNPIATTTGNQTYYVTTTDASGCSAKDSVKITVNPLPLADAGIDHTICSGQSVTLTPSGGVTYVWSPASGLSCVSCTNPSANPTSTKKYYVIVTDINGCSKNDSTTVNVNPLPTANAGPDQAKCPGASAQLNASGGVNYSWSPYTGLSCTGCQNPVATPPSTTTYTVTVTDANGCNATDAMILTINPIPAVDAGPNKAICKGKTTTLNGTAGGTSFSWTSSPSLSCTNCLTPVASPTSTQKYYITTTDAIGCSAKDSVVVTVNSLPTVDAGPDQTICSGKNVTLSPNGGISYVWSPSAGLSCTSCTNPIATPTSTTKYLVTGTDVNGCVNSDTTHVIVNPAPVANAGPDQYMCIGSTVQLNGSGGLTYSWSPSSGLSCTNCQNPVSSTVVSQVYTLTVTDANGCQGQDNVIVNPESKPVTDFSVDYLLACEGLQGIFTNKTTGATSYSWDFGDGGTSTDVNPSHVYASAGKQNTTTLTASNNGCTSTYTLSGLLASSSLIFNYPNFITPNNDNVNDCLEFKIPASANFNNCFELTVYNRWGKKMYETNDPTKCWDGRNQENGKMVSEGVYYYIVKIRDEVTKNFVQVSY